MPSHWLDELIDSHQHFEQPTPHPASRVPDEGRAASVVTKQRHQGLRGQLLSTALSKRKRQPSQDGFHCSAELGLSLQGFSFAGLK